MFLILNRFPRGTYSWGAKFNGVVLGLITYLVFHDVYVAIAVAFGYVLGESFGWGLWVGTLTQHGQYMDEDEGQNNGIKWLSKKIVPNHKEEFIKYCRVALTIRGFYWWIPTLVPLMFVLPWFDVFSAIVLLSILFPLACEIGYKLQYLFSLSWNKDTEKYEIYINQKLRKTFKKKIPFSIKGGWEHQEVWYGLMQDIVFIGLVLTYL